MGEVYRAYDERLDRWVAVKHIRERSSQDQMARQRLRREARTVAALSHPSIVQIHDIFELEGGDWIVMEWVDGATVQQLLAGGPLPLTRALMLAIEVVDGLGEAHAHGIVHRDLKAENVMLSASGHAKILDFGLAQGLRAEEDEALSVEGEVMGTGRAMAPEQILGLPVDPRSDLFSFGIFLYEMCTGESPFLDASLAQTLAHVCGRPHRSAKELRSEMPTALSELLDDLLAKDPEDRPPNAEEVARRLRQVAGLPLPEPPSALSPPPGDRRGRFPRPPPAAGRRVLWGVAGLLLAGFLVLWTVVVERPGRDGPTPSKATAPSDATAAELYFKGVEALKHFDAQGAQEFLSAAIVRQEDFALAHAALSQAWSTLGFDAKAAESARRASALAVDLSRRDSLWIEGLRHATEGEWEQASHAYGALWGFYPDRLEYGLSLAAAQTAGGHGKDALSTLDALRRLPSPDGADRRIDLATAEASLSLSLYGQALESARHAQRQEGGEPPTELRAEAQRLEGLAFYYLADYAASQEAYGEAQGLFGLVQDRGREARVKCQSANLLLSRGQIAKAELLYREAIASHRDIGSHKWLAEAQNGLAFLEQVRGNLQAASLLLEEAMASASVAGDRLQEAKIRDTEIWVLLQQGRWMEARQLASENLVLCQEIGAKHYEAWAYFYLGRTALYGGDLIVAEAYYQQALALAEASSFSGLGGVALRAKAELLLYRGRSDEAQRLLQDPRTQSVVFGEHVKAAHLLLQGRLALVDRHPSEAAALGRQAVDLLSPTQRLDELLVAESFLGLAQLQSGQLEAGRSILQRLATTASQSQNPETRWTFQWAEATLRHLEGDSQSAAAILRRGQLEAEQLSIEPWRLRFTLERARLARLAGEPGANKALRQLATEALAGGFDLFHRQAQEALVRLSR